MTKTSDESSYSTSENEFDLKAFRADYLDQDEKGPSVDKYLAELFKDFREKGLSKEKVALWSKGRPVETCPWHRSGASLDKIKIVFMAILIG